jgi:hypothetical protein
MSLSATDQQVVRMDAQERYIAYAFLRQSGAQHAHLKMDLQNDYTTGDNRYPKNHQQTLYLLDKYSKTTGLHTTLSEGARRLLKRREEGQPANSIQAKPKPMTKSIGRIRNVSNATRRDTHPQIVRTLRMTTKSLAPARPEV